MSEMVLISIHPRFAEAIARGEKTVEFRRRWTKREISHLVIYATAPVKQILTVVSIDEVIEDRPATLWKLSQSRGGGLSKSEFNGYFDGIRAGFGVCLGSVTSLRRPIDPYEKFKGFRAPQSFRFITSDEMQVLRRAIR